MGSAVVSVEKAMSTRGKDTVLKFTIVTLRVEKGLSAILERMVLLYVLRRMSVRRSALENSAEGVHMVNCHVMDCVLMGIPLIYLTGAAQNWKIVKTSVGEKEESVMMWPSTVKMVM